ncbi:FliM/FliN family flagellar motor switch protein [Marinicellulosiphila megalodicopiae]|uniref:FliM/FliN family flagellar motor switch protein n=1 Tax=Marinicellulosiphila megalodicopiae TaxID=2724896 RepID=UPI003BAE92B8
MLIGNNFLKFIENQLTTDLKSWCKNWFDFDNVSIEFALNTINVSDNINDISFLIQQKFNAVPNAMERKWTENSKSAFENFGYTLKLPAQEYVYLGFYITIKNIQEDLQFYVVPNQSMIEKFCLQSSSTKKHSVNINRLISKKLTKVEVSTLTTLHSYQRIQSLKIGDVLKSGHKINIPLNIHVLDQKLTGFLGQQQGKKSLLLESNMTDVSSKESNIEYQELVQDSDKSTQIIGVNQLQESIQVPISIELGEGEISLKTLSELKSGEIIKLNQSIDDLVVLKANGIEVGKGVLTIEDGEFSIKVTDIASLSI